MRAIFPTRALGILLSIGILDLIATLLLHSQGLIEERNPLMQPVLDHGAWSFALIKIATLVAAWILLARQAKTDMQPVRVACFGGSALYLALLFVAAKG